MFKRSYIKCFRSSNFSGSQASRNSDSESSSCSTDELYDGIDSETMVLIVSDSGVGMSSEDCARMSENAEVFDPSRLQVSTRFN